MFCVSFFFSDRSSCESKTEVSVSERFFDDDCAIMQKNNYIFRSLFTNISHITFEDTRIAYCTLDDYFMKDSQRNRDHTFIGINSKN